MKIDYVDVLSLSKRSHGLDLVFGAYKIHKIIPNESLFCTYLEIGDDPMGESWSHGHVRYCEHY